MGGPVEGGIDPIEWECYRLHQTFHIWPINQDHRVHEECPCNPNVVFLSRGCVMIHNDMDNVNVVNEAYSILNPNSDNNDYH
jgi:hypothetical protein